MLKTPTYHVFDLYKEHQDADAVYCYNDFMSEYENVPMITSSASVKNNKLTITITNSSLSDSVKIECSTAGFVGSKAFARILTNEVHAYNDFDAPDRVAISDLDVSISSNQIYLELPPCSVASVTIES